MKLYSEDLLKNVFCNRTTKRSYTTIIKDSTKLLVDDFMKISYLAKNKLDGTFFQLFHSDIIKSLEGYYMNTTIEGVLKDIKEEEYVTINKM